MEKVSATKGTGDPHTSLSFVLLLSFFSLKENTVIVGRNGVVDNLFLKVSSLFCYLVGNYIMSEIVFVVYHALGIGGLERS